MKHTAAALAFPVALGMSAFLLGACGMSGAGSYGGAAPSGDWVAQADTEAAPYSDTSAIDNMSACQLVMSLATGSPGASVRVSVGHFRDEVADVDRSGCTITIGGSWSALGEGASALDTISNVLTDRGWRDDPRYAEDTSGGTRFALVRGGAICIFQGFWDAGNPSDSTYTPSDEYTFVIRCASPRP